MTLIYLREADATMQDAQDRSVDNHLASPVDERNPEQGPKANDKMRLLRSDNTKIDFFTDSVEFMI